MRQKIWLREMKLITLLFLIAMMVLALPEYILAQMTFERTYDGEGWDDAGNVVPSGVYFCRLNEGDYHSTKKLLLLK